MRAEYLLRKKAIRRYPVILSEEHKLMDTSYMDPNDPVIISRYDPNTGRIIVEKEDGYAAILDRSYDDDKWVEATKDINSINIPAGYHSIQDVYDAIDRRKNSMKSIPVDADRGDDNFSNLMDKINEIGKLIGALPDDEDDDYTEDDDISTEYYSYLSPNECIDLLKRKIDASDNSISVRIASGIKSDDVVSECITIERISLTGDDEYEYSIDRDNIYPEITIIDSVEFSRCIKILLDRDINIVKDLNDIMKFAHLDYGFKYINDLIKQEDHGVLKIYGCGCLYAAMYKNGKIAIIGPLTNKNDYNIFNHPDIKEVVLSFDESAFLLYNLQDTEKYVTTELKIQH